MARSGYTPALAELVERGDVSPARLLVEVVKSTRRDVKDTQADYDGADSLTGLTTLPEGGVRITGSDTTHVEHAVDDGPSASDIDAAGLEGPWGDAIGAVVVEWADPDEVQELHAFEARLDPNVSGGGVQVTTWVAQLFNLAEVSMDPGGGQRQVWRTTPISGQTRVTAIGSLSTVSFVFTVQGETPRIGPAPIVAPDVTGEPAPTRPTTIGIVWALKAEGEVAGNVAWRCQASLRTTVDNGHTVKRYDFTRISPDDRIELGERLLVDSNAFGLPRFAFKGKAFTQQTITWTTEPLDLEAAPTDPVAMILEGDQPGDSTLVGEIWDGSDWEPFSDGDLIGVDNTANGGGDLSAISATEEKDVRADLNPTTDGTATPILRRIGMEERVSEVFDELVEVDGYDVVTDPITLRTSIPVPILRLYKSGVQDYRDFATELLSTYFPADIVFRLWWGHPTLVNRKDWLHLDDFEIRDVQPADGYVEVPLVHPLERLLRTIPIQDTVAQTRTRLVYEAKSLKFIWDDLVDGQIGLPGRLIGPGVTDDVTLAGKEVVRVVPGVDELDRIAFLDGSTAMGSQGRLKARPMFDRSAPRAHFSPEEIDLSSVRAGFPSRVTDYTVPFGWDPRKDAGRGSWSGEVQATASAVVARLGRAFLQNVTELARETAEWIPQTTAGPPPTSTLATTIAKRMLEHAAGGIPVLTWKTTGHARPWLENGDRVALPTDMLIGLDPARDGQPIRGPVIAICRLIGVHNLEGTHLTGWIQDYTDILPSSLDLEHVGFSDPRILEWNATFGVDGSLTLTGQLSTDAQSVRAVSGAGFASRATVNLETEQTVDAEGYFSFQLDPAGTWDFDDVVKISGVAWEKSDATGAESEIVYQLELRRDPTQLDGKLWVTVNTADENLDLRAIATGPSSLFPATLTIYQDDPEGASLQVHAFAASGDTIGPTGSGETAEYAALTDIALAKSGAVAFFGTLVSASGAVTPLYSMGDLNSLPEGAVTVEDYATNPVVRVTYDDDVAEIIVTVPGGKAKTFTGLSGGGLETYTVGDTLDDVTTESDLGEGETRTGYKVTVYAVASAAGLSKEIFDGSLHGVNAAEPNRLAITGSRWYVAGTILTLKLYGYGVNVSPGPDTLSMKVEYDDGSGAVSYTFNFAGSTFHVLRESDGTTTALYANSQTGFTITYTPYTGLNGTGTAGAPIPIPTGDAQESGGGSAGEDNAGTVISGNFIATRPTFDFQARAADDEPELILRTSFNAGSKSGTWTPNTANGMSQYATASGVLTINAPTGLVAGESFLLRVVTGSNSVTFAGVEGPVLNWTSGTIWASFHHYGAAIALLGAAG